MRLQTSDENLWQAFKSGQENAFTDIYQKNISALISYGCKLTSDTSLIEDCIHDIFIELWRRRFYLSDVTSINFYLLRALNRKLKRKIIQQQTVQRRRKDYRFLSFINICEMPIEFRWIDEQIAAENSQKLQNAIEKLSDRQREVLIMHYYEGRNYAEIASVININYQSVANLLCRTIKKLRKEYSIHNKKEIDGV